jgi:hypothetical protein
MAWNPSIRHPYQRELLWRRRSFSRITVREVRPATALNKTKWLDRAKA